ncbi:UDP-2,3-diacylglucosamine diphosphatase [Candidatus Pantoea carbekii]|uniref:UDP-2,3-diacylglucosamine hydrolase n=1 Tax=Candidatus Pantoea carbekii TaxID=1235990 RepID=U3U3K4_9GAMM|nr:UDP-2,3-diacylglucosamine diphosphatase [Candidatus Pantoea carbekii]AKC32217.1 UDP-2,3-diacylglucosamine hydrolase LpxH [Candidatus Pantoea carbekii]BAO00751.1 LpxH protein [Candidatus Pantoea carbekii]
MSRTLFIADIHLSHKEPAVTAVFLHFLETEAQQCDALYLLGDLFEVWLGDDHSNFLIQKIADRLKALKVPKFFIHGNRDFLLGQRFACASGMVLLPEEQVLTLYGQRILIMHGDTLCTDDASYQHFRSTVHKRWLQRLFLILPVYLRGQITALVRASSKQVNQNKSISVMDVNQQTVEDVMIHQQVNMLIHGHTHRPAIHNFNLQGKSVQRAVLGAWYQSISVIQLDSNGIQLIELPF